MAKLNNLRALSSEELTKFHEATLKVLNRTGVIFEDDATLEMFKKHGAKVEGHTVFMPPKMVEDAIARCPETFEWHGMDEQYKLSIGGESQVIGPVVSSVMTYDESIKRARPSTFEDVEKLTKLYQSSKVMQIVAANTTEPGDLPADERYLRTMYQLFQNSTKPMLCYNCMKSGREADEMLDMLELAFGPFDGRVVVGHSMTVFSPLKYEGPVLDTMKAIIKRNQPPLISTCALTGITSSIDLLGSAVAQNAEGLAAIVFIQLFQPGCPTVLHFSNTIGNMKRGTSAWGSPESLLLSMPNFQAALELYKIPTRSIAGVTTSKKPDYQGAMETTQSLMASILCGANIHYDTAGGLDDLTTISLEKYLMDEEAVDRVMRIRKGIDFSEDAFDLDTIHAVGQTGTFLTEESTLNKFRDRWMPMISDWNTGGPLEEDIVHNTNKELENRLAAAPETFLDTELDKELRRYMEKTLHDR